MMSSPVLAIVVSSAALAGIEVTQTQPVVARGGVLVLPVEGDASPWPDTLRLELDDGSPPVDAVVAWIGAAPAGVERFWTMADERLDIRQGSAMPTDPAIRASGATVAIAAMPRGFEGSLRCAGTRITPRWLALAETEPDAGRQAMPLSAMAGRDQPDPSAPTEWFRWWLMADAIGARPPAVAGGPVEGLLALHAAQLWQAGLERVERVSPGVARELVSRLTAVCSEAPGVATAAWIAGAEDQRTLLGLLLDGSRSDAQVMESVLSWVRSLPPVTVWIESDDGRSIRLVALNPGPEEVILRLAWVDAEGMPPLPLRVPARGVGRQTLERPPSLLPDLATSQVAPRGGAIQLEWRDWSHRITVPPSLARPRPPGLPMGLLRPPMSLADAQRGRIMPPPEAFATTASVRRSDGAWEVFAECLRPQLAELDELVVLVGTDGGVMGRVVAREQGEIAVEGFPPGVTPRVERTSFRDRWRCVITMPAGWPGAASAGPASMLVGVARSPGGVGTRQCAGPAVPPWTPIPLVRLDPSAWWSVGDVAAAPDR
jgi:hypothetical protein